MNNKRCYMARSPQKKRYTDTTPENSLQARIAGIKNDSSKSKILESALLDNVFSFKLPHHHNRGFTQFFKGALSLY